MTRGWIDAWRRSHTWWAAAATAGIALWCAFLDVPSIEAQLWALVAIAVPTALPHGAVDHLAGRKLFRGRAWFLNFSLAYLGVAALVIGIWWLAPEWALLAFLFISVLHFGVEDSAGGDWWLRGLLPVLGPVLFWPAETAQVFAWLLLDGDPGRALAATETVAVAKSIFVAGWIALAGWYAQRREWADAIEIVSLLLLVSLAPPLVAFAVYFCGWHSVRHGLVQASELAPHDARRGIFRYLREAWPLTLATALLGAVAFFALRQTAGALAMVFFIGLAALTVPHMIVQGCAARFEMVRR